MEGPGSDDYKIAERFRKKRSYERALKSYAKAIKADSTEFRYWFSRGKCLFQLKDFGGAYLDFKVASELNPEYAPAFALMAKIGQRRRHYDQSINNYWQAAQVAAKPERKVGYLLECAKMSMVEDQNARALNFLDQAAIYDSENLDIAYYRAKIFNKIGGPRKGAATDGGRETKIGGRAGGEEGQVLL